MSLLELHFLGTGTSGCLPAISCITAPERGCECCLSSLTPEGKKNQRRNTSAVLRVKPKKHRQQQANGKGKHYDDDGTKTILIDCGKSFLTSALEWFPKKGFRRIDALIITHPHSDAMSGLDDLRGWTLGGAIQDTMDIYVNRSTFEEIERTYPYLVSSELATGGGDVPAMNYIIFDDDKTFDVCGVTVTPLPVHHGWYFTKKEPYFCLGFLFNQSIAYISDVSFIPETTWDLLLGKTTLEGRASKEVKNTSKDPEQVAADANRTLSNGHLNGINGSDASSHTHGTSSSAAPPVLVVDCLRVYPHTSHFGIAQAVATARRLGAQRNYMIGFAHRVTHATWEKVARAIGSGERPKHPPQVRPGGLQAEASKLSFGAFSKHMRHSEDGDELKEIALQVVEEWEGGPQGPLWIRPSFDGQTIYVDEETGQCWDDEYSAKMQ